MTHLWIPLAFLAGALSGGAVVWFWRARRAAEGGASRWQKTKLVGATVVLTALALAALGYGFARQRFQRTRASKATMSKAVSDFRKAKGGAAEKRGQSPPGGVYQYAATGFYEIDAPVVGKDHRVLPRIVPGVLKTDGDCWELTLRYFTQHHWTARYCRGPRGGLRFIWVKNRNEFFSMKSQSQTFCTPDVILRPGGLPGPGPGSAPGTEWKESCKRKSPHAQRGKAKVDITIRYVGLERVAVGKGSVAAFHLRSTFTMEGMASGTFHQDFWYAQGSGLLIGLATKGKAAGMGSFVSDYRLTLKSLTPAR